MITPIMGWVLLAAGLVSMVIDLVFFEKKAPGEALLAMQFLLPRKPLGRIGNLMVVLGAISLVYSHIIL